jgi:hypothetical protein
VVCDDDEHVWFESWLEPVMLLDFDPAVVGIATQPFWLVWTDKAASVFPMPQTFLTRRADGSAMVIECRPVRGREPRDVAKFEATGRAVRAGAVGVPADRRRTRSWRRTCGGWPATTLLGHSTEWPQDAQRQRSLISDSLF